MKRAGIVCILYIVTLCSGVGYGGLSGVLEPIARPGVIEKKEVAKSEVVVKGVLEEKEVESKVVRKHVGLVEDENMYRVSVVEVLSRLGKELVDMYEVDGEMKLTPLSVWNDVKVRARDYEIVFTEVPVGSLSSTLPIKFKIMGDGEEVGRWSISVRCEIWKDVYYAKERLSRGSEIVRGALSLRRVDVLRLNGQVAPDGLDLSMYEMSTTTMPDKPLLWENIEMKPQIRKGRVVDVLAEEGGMKIVTKGLALQSGVMNQFIKVRNLASKKDIEAQVLNEGMVKVYF